MGTKLGIRIKGYVKKVTMSMTTLLLLIIAYCVMDLLGIIGGENDKTVFAVVFFILSLIYTKKDDITKFFGKRLGQSIGSIKRGVFLDRIVVILSAGVYGYYAYTVGLPIEYNIGMSIFVFCIVVVKFGITRWVWNQFLYRMSSMKKIDKMSGRAFEAYIEALFSSRGYKVYRTQLIGNYGLDMIIEKDGNITAVQTKRYSRNVGPVAVREVIEGKAYYKCDKAFVVTNRNYTTGAIELGKSSGVELFGRAWLTR